MKDIKEANQTLNRFVEIGKFLVKDDNILQAGIIIQEQYAQFPKCKDGGGAYQLLLSLIQNCSKKQSLQVSNLFMEWASKMYYLLLENLLLEKIKMHEKFQDDRMVEETRQIAKVWKDKEWIRREFN